LNNPIDPPPLNLELHRIMKEKLGSNPMASPDISAEQLLNIVGNDPGTPDAVIDQGGAVKLTHLKIPAASGEEQIPVLIVEPSGRTGGPLPCLYYTANGGKIRQGATAGVTPFDTALVATHGIVLVSISPRVGPKHRHPAQVEDAYAGLEWLNENATQLGIDPTKIIIMGKSGGGGIAASTAIYARDRGGPPIAYQMLIYPMLDDRTVTVSSRYAAAGWGPRHNQIGWNAILGDATGGPDVDSYAAAARETNLKGLPPAYVEVGSSEIFRDEDLQYACRMAEAGVPVELHSWMGGFHGFEIVAPDAALSRSCLQTRESFLARALTDMADIGPSPAR